MSTPFRFLKWFGIGIVALLVVSQFIRPAKTNPANIEAHALEAHVQVSAPAAAILDRACRDCHSNDTRWPWYSHVAPVSWYVIDHVNHGRSHLNFSEWGSFSNRDAEAMLKAICKEVKSGAMPLTSYTRMHRSAKLSPEDVQTLCDWTTAEAERLGMP